MSRYDYQQSQEITAADPPFAALIMAAMRKADSTNSRLLAECFPDIYWELQQRYNAPGGYLPGEMSGPQGMVPTHE